MRAYHDIPTSEITPESLYLDRRRFLRLGAAGALGTLLPATAGGCEPSPDGAAETEPQERPEQPTSYEDVTTYNNFYEFGFDKSDPARNAHTLRPRPWSIAVEGLVEQPGVYALEDVLKPARLEDRVYRLRCVEGWSMVIPWRGFPLADLIQRVRPRPAAQVIEFQTLFDPEQMPGQRSRVLDWPYVEGLRLDEAMHPLTLLATGLYGRDLPNQNGAPLRLVVPWKYGFKSIKSIVKLSFLDRQPVSSWERASPGEYGFYANVNPDVDHPRWSQQNERRIGELRRRPTLPFNGYADQVARLYEGMDLRRYY